MTLHCVRHLCDDEVTGRWIGTVAGASEELEVWRKEGWRRGGLKAVMKERRILAELQTVAGGSWGHKWPLFGGVPGKQRWGAEAGLRDEIFQRKA